ncbi:MAG: hypothetical protein IPJ45_02515 [Ignavibacteria bacterium]|nr:hypothetical protein [Ignavibacteria bacterium]
MNILIIRTTGVLNNRIKRTLKSLQNTDSTFDDIRFRHTAFLNLSLTPRFDFITLTPFFSYNEIWYNKYISKNFNTADSTVVTKR